MHHPGKLLAGRYRLDKQVGSGGMGQVWRATDQTLGRVVAVKVMRPEHVAQTGFAKRFLAEAQAMATIKHHAVVGVYDYHGDASGAFLVMEYVEGESLSERLNRTGRLDPVATMSLVAQTADALQAAHDKGVVHRDVKPSNLLVSSDDTLVLTDFGIARSASSSAQLTVTGTVIGTPSYLAPEQVLGQPATPRADVYALGVVAYECLTGQLPFSGDNPFAIATKRLQELPPAIGADTPAAVITVVERALAKDPNDRWASASELAHAARTAATTNDQSAAVTQVQPTAATEVWPAAAHEGEPATVPNLRPVPAAATLPASPTRPTTALSDAVSTAKPDEPGPKPKPAPPATVVAASVFLCLAAASLAVYAAALATIVPDVVTVTDDVLAIYYPTTARAVIAAAWAVTAGYGVLVLLFLLLAWQNSRGNQTARTWTFVLGFATLLVGAPLGVVSAFVFGSLQPSTDYRRELLAVVPSSYVPVTIVAGLIGMGTLLVALVLLMLRPADKFFAGRDQPR